MIKIPHGVSRGDELIPIEAGQTISSNRRVNAGHKVEKSFPFLLCCLRDMKYFIYAQRSPDFIRISFFIHLESLGHSEDCDKNRRPQ